MRAIGFSRQPFNRHRGIWWSPKHTCLIDRNSCPGALEIYLWWTSVASPGLLEDVDTRVCKETGAVFQITVPRHMFKYTWRKLHTYGEFNLWPAWHPVYFMRRQMQDAIFAVGLWPELHIAGTICKPPRTRPKMRQVYLFKQGVPAYVQDIM
jgi:hypothetical protein